MIQTGLKLWVEASVAGEVKINLWDDNVGALIIRVGFL